MLFNSIEFLIYLPIIFILYWFVFQKNFKIQTLFIVFLSSLLSGKILPQRKLPRTITFRNISSEAGLIKYIFDVASFEEDLTK